MAETNQRQPAEFLEQMCFRAAEGTSDGDSIEWPSDPLCVILWAVAGDLNLDKILENGGFFFEQA